MIVAVTGHRPVKITNGDKLNAYDSTVFDRVVALAAASLKHVKAEVVISGMALGWDMAIAEAARQLKLPLWAYVPFEGQESRWPTASRKYYEELRGYAAKEVVVCTGEYHVTKMQIRNERMVDDSDLVLAFYDGSTGGTHNCIRYAQRQHKSVMNVYRSWEKHRAGTGVATDSPSEGAVS